MIKRAGHPYTIGYYLNALDFTYNDAGNLVREPESQRIYVSLFVKTLWVSLLITAICLFLGYPIAYLIDRRRRASSGAVTHPVPPRTADFLTPWLTWLARAVAVLPLASWLVLSDRFWSGGLLSVAPIAVVAATEWAQLRIASGPHHAATGLDLAYDDGFRSLAIVSLAGLPAVAALVAASGISYHTRSELGLQVVMVALVAATVFRILTLVPGMSRRFRHRLSAVS